MTTLLALIRLSFSVWPFFILFYIYGSIPFAFIFTYLIKGVKIFEHRTGNVGVANAFGVGGYAAGFLTVAGEFSKVLLPLAVSRLFFDGDLTVTLLLIIFSSIGSSYSIFLRGRGGMGTTILMLTLLIFAPLTLLVLLATWIVTSRLVKDTYHTSLINNTMVPAAIFGVTGNIPLSFFGATKAAIFFLKYDRSKDDFQYWESTSKLVGDTRPKKYVKKLEEIRNNKLIGEKASNLKNLLKKGYRIPDTYVCTNRAYIEYMRGNKEVIPIIERELSNIIDENKIYSVRSSANVEDMPGHSFAGQFKTYLNVRGLKQLMQSVEGVWLSTSSDKIRSYLEQLGFSEEMLEMAVIVQVMVPAEYSGVVFTKNPINGRDEVIVESVPGLGDSLVQKGVTPDRWVNKWGEWIEVPDNAAMELDLVAEIVRQAKEMERASGKPLNLEWAHDSEQLYWLQQREITTISGLNFYSNRIPKEFMPGIIKPLVWSVNIPVVCGAWIRLLTEVIGDNDLRPDKLAKQFYHRAYFNMGAIGEVFDLLGMPREGLELLMGLEVAGKEKPRMRPGPKAIKLMPRIIRLALDKAFYSRKFERFLFDHEDKCRQFDLSDVDKLDVKETIQVIDELFSLNEEAAYNLIVSYLLNSIYSMMLKGRLEKLGLSIDEIDMGADNYKDIDPGHHLSVLHSEYRNLSFEAQRKITDLGYEQLTACEELKDFSSKIDDFIHCFGHLSERGNDFSCVPWREDPDLVMGMVAGHGQEGVGMGPRKSAVLPGGLLNRWVTGAIHGRAVKHREYKERISFLYTYS